MRSHTLGDTGLTVSKIGLGGMPLSIAGRPGEARALATVRAAVEAGVTFFDTADVYCLSDDDLGHNERVIAKGLRAAGVDPGAVVVATKGGLERPDGAWTTNGRPEHLKRACERSLKALGVERITLYQLHAPDDDVPFADSVGALAELQKAGKIEHVGLSNVDVGEIETARRIVDVVTVQNRANPFDRESFDNGVVALCEQVGITFLPYSPVGGHRGKARTPEDRTLSRVAARHDASTYQICLAWLLAQSDSVLPIPGASRPGSIESSAAAAAIELTDEDRAELEAAFPTGMLDD